MRLLARLESLNSTLIIATFFVIPISILYYKGYFLYEPIKRPLFFILLDIIIIISGLLLLLKDKINFTFDATYIVGSTFLLFMATRGLISDSSFSVAKGELFLRLFLLYSLSLQVVKRNDLKVKAILVAQLIIISSIGILQSVNILNPATDIYGSKMYNSLFSHSNSAGHYVAILLPICLGVIINRKKIVLSVILILPILIYILLISCKSVILGLTLALFIFCFKSITNKIHRIGILLLFLCLEIFAILMWHFYFKSDQAILIRLGIWSSMLPLIKENLFFGIGSGELPFDLTPYYDDYLKWLTGFYNIHIYEAHNDFLEILAENGIFALILFLSIFLIIFFKQKTNAVFYSIIIFGVCAFFNFPMDEISTLILLVLLLSYAGAFAGGNNYHFTLTRLKTLKFITVGLLFFMPFLVKFDFEELSSPLYYIKAREERDLSRKFNLLNKAIIGNENNIKLFHELSLFVANEIDKKNGIKFYEEFTRRAPNMPTVYSNFGMILAQDNQCLESERFFKKAFELNPYHPSIYLQYIEKERRCLSDGKQFKLEKNFYNKYIASLKEPYTLW